MVDFLTNDDGSIDDRVRLHLGGNELLIAKDYEVSCRFFEVPNAFSINVGSAQTSLELMKAFPPNTLFRLAIGPVFQFTGRTDGFERSSTAATELAIRGRDCLARLVDNHILADRSFTHATFEEITRAAIEDAGIKGYSLIFDLNAQRQAVAGTPIVKTYEFTVGPFVGPEALTVGSGINYGILAREDTTTITVLKGYKADKPIEMKFGETDFAFLKKELDRGGVFLRAAVDPDGADEFVFQLGAPDGQQAPLYGLINQRGPNPSKNYSNVFPPKLSNMVTGRHAAYHLEGTAGSDKDGRKKVFASFIDEEMVAQGHVKAWAKKDTTVKSVQHALYLCKKECSEARRKGRSFTYPMRGHTLPLLKNPSRRAIVVPDTTIYVKDDEYGIDGVFWIEGCNYRGSSDNGTTTELTLMLPEDLIFGDGDFTRGKRDKKAKVFGKRKR
jgi:prophage tail gpP-like protein